MELLQRSYVLGAPQSALQGQVRCWPVHLHLGCEPDATVLDMLGPSERQELQFFQQRNDRVRYACMRAALRQVLVQEYGFSSTLTIVRTPFGKPVLQDIPGLDFNLSHAGAKGLIAMSQAGQVGVDVEEKVPGALDGLVEYLCTPVERVCLANLEPAARQDALFSLWVAKEAALKAVGVGIAGEHMPFLSLLANGGVQSLAILPFDANQIRVEMLPSIDGYSAAVALLSIFKKESSEYASTRY
nr:4'-phosphopantetheinyl transferase superfamily protein [uncultured Rhodoferax sp.]